MGNRAKFIVQNSGKSVDGFVYSAYPEFHNNNPEHPNFIIWPTARTEGMLSLSATVDLGLVAGDAIYVDISKVTEADPLPTGTILSKLQFLERFTPEEFAAIKAASIANPQIDYIWQLFQAAAYIDTIDERVITGMNILVTAELLTEERKTTILTV